ncbi:MULTISPECIES: hypothetical protein [Bacillus]|uniref:hypothetical protein n=1 Tax=Bacillus TaxID=1386 RepID=UPI001FF0CEA6|nr:MULTISPECIES: hypothetical protein [Bacillus]MCY7498227.1 hypothetical protein [Bacillus altitudinis]MCY7535444.1 hypothetical protein [Bacillus altitudinis]MCY7545461.1 hypothetical protein [Bacillus altitudinis]MCY7553561.1 hypothetical protein [Bacillus altitudinis]MCY7592203.1 hypothetical protein [Bacillus altitudinis]
MLYYFTASDKAAQKHFYDTIQNPYHIKPFLNLIDVDVAEKLKDHELAEHVHMWGSTPGTSNIKRWSKLKEGDKVLAYSKGIFYYYGTIFAKTRNSTLAEKVWGKDKHNQTYEYIYFIKGLKSVNFETKKFARFFGYKQNFTPQGFSNIREDLLNIKLNKYHDLDELINDLNSNFLLPEEDELVDSYQEALDSNYSDVIVEPEDTPHSRKKPQKVNGKQVWPRNSKFAKAAIKKADFKCEIDNSHQTFLSETSKEPFMEAHHLVPMHMQHEFEVSLDRTCNIVSLCPTCHRRIHHANSKDKKLLLEHLFNSRQGELKLVGINIELEYLLNSYNIIS